MTGQSAVNGQSPLVLHEGFILDHDSNMVVTIHVDFRLPDERSPIGALIKYGQGKHAIEEGGTIQLARPPYFRKKGETLIYDEGEGRVVNQTVTQREAPAAVQDASIQSLGDTLDEAAASVGLTVFSKDITMREGTITDADEITIEWGQQGFLAVLRRNGTNIRRADQSAVGIP